MQAKVSVLRIAVVVAVVSAGSAAGVFLWLRFVEGDYVLPEPPGLHRMAPFNILLWAGLLAPAAGVVCGIAAFGAARRGGERRAGVVPALLICLLAAACYWPLSVLTTTRIDRVQGLVPAPLVSARLLGAAAMATFALCAVFMMVASMRHSPLLVRYVARASLVVFAGVLLHLYLLMLFIPEQNGWVPADFHRTDLLMPLRSCRGALVWVEAGSGQYVSYARIDDLWSRFADPRTPGASRAAISMIGEMQRGYIWMAGDELKSLRVRRDDPAVANCSDRVRSEQVAPASWHRLGMSW